MYWDNESHLDVIELLAEENGLISSEEELSEIFDAEIAPIYLKSYGEPGVEFTDTIMMNEAFNNWSDELCKSGEIHTEQYNDYCYRGKWS